MANKTTATSKKKTSKTKAKTSAGIKAGMRFEVVSLSLVEPTLKAARAKGARLCSGGGTCVALVDISTK